MFKRGKRGSFLSIYFVLLQVLVVGLAAVFLFMFVGNISDGHFLEADYVTRELALSANAVYVAPGNVHYRYDNRYVDIFEYDFSRDRVNLAFRDEDGESKLSRRYYFGADRHFVAPPSRLVEPDLFLFRRDGFSFEVGDDLPRNLTSFYFPLVDVVLPPTRIVSFVVPVADHRSLVSVLFPGRSIDVIAPTSLSYDVLVEVVLTDDDVVEVEIPFGSALASRRLASHILNRLDLEEGRGYVSFSDHESLSSARVAAARVVINRDYLKDSAVSNAVGDFFG